MTIRLTTSAISVTTRLRRASPDLLALAALLFLACLPFAQPVLDPDKIPAGLDLLQHYSRESFNRRAFAAGKLPLWNPYEFSGFPAQADPQTGVFYPPSVVFRFLTLPSFLTWTIVFHVWMFGAGGYVLCRVVGVRRVPAAIASAGLMLGGITMPRVYAGHLDMLRTVAWLPLALALAIKSIDRASIRPSALLVLVLSLQVLGGFVQLVCYTFACIAFYGAFSAVWPRAGPGSWRHARTLSIQLALLALLVSGVTAFQLLPTARLVLSAGRTHGVPYADAAQPSFGVPQLQRFFLPLLDGAGVPPESWETSSYIGLLFALLAPLAVFARRQRRSAMFFALVGGAALAIAAGHPVYRLHHLAFPMFRIPGRLICFWSVSMCILGALALDWLTEPRAPRAVRPRSPARRLVLGVAATVALAAVALMVSRAAGPDLGSVAAQIVVAVLVVSSRISPSLRGLVLIMAGVAVPLDLSAYASRFVEVRAFEDRFLQTPPFTPSPGGRVLALCEKRLMPGELTALGVPSVDGYNSYFLGDYARFALLARGVLHQAYLVAYSRIGAFSTLPRLDLLNMLNVTEIISCAPIESSGLELVARQEPFYVYRNTRAGGRVMTVCASSDVADAAAGQALLDMEPGDELRKGGALAERCQQANEAEWRVTIAKPCRCPNDVQVRSRVTDVANGTLRVAISSAAPHVLLLSEPYYPERQATIDGVETSIHKLNVALSGIRVGAGTHVVEVKYVPTSLYYGTLLSAVTTLLWCVAYTRRGGRRLSRGAGTASATV